MGVNASGNVHVTGYFEGTVDFDPGPGPFHPTSAGGDDADVSKPEASGNFAWAGSIGGSGNDYRGGVAVDAAGNLYATGWFTGTADLDPGPGGHSVTSAGSEDTYVCKPDAAGTLVRAVAIGGSGDDLLKRVTLDGAGNVYTPCHSAAPWTSTRGRVSRPEADYHL